MADDDERRAASQWLDAYRARPTANKAQLADGAGFRTE